MFDNTLEENMYEPDLHKSSDKDINYKTLKKLKKVKEESARILKEEKINMTLIYLDLKFLE